MGTTPLSILCGRVGRQGAETVLVTEIRERGACRTSESSVQHVWLETIRFARGPAEAL